jgi:hypothetical protein
MIEIDKIIVEKAIKTRKRWNQQGELSPDLREAHEVLVRVAEAWVKETMYLAVFLPECIEVKNLTRYREEWLDPAPPSTIERVKEWANINLNAEKCVALETFLDQLEQEEEA